MSTTAEKKYVWLKLKEDFFSSKRIKKLRKMAGGDTYTIIYLKMQLLSLKTDGILKYTGLEDNFAAELALDLDESPEDVSVVLMYLASCGLIETSDNVNFLLPYVVANTGSETDAAQRMREMRKRNNVTPALRSCYTEKEIDREIEKEEEKDITPKPPKRGKGVFVPPTLEEVEAYCKSRNSTVDPKQFWEYFDAGDWIDSKGQKVRSWKQKLITWEKGGYGSAGASKQSGTSGSTPKVQGKYDGVNFYDNV